MKTLRRGFTTGTCAAAAAKAAVTMLYSRTAVSEVSLLTPAGVRLNLTVEEPVITGGMVSCCIRKDSGDDPDVTNGMLIYASAEKADNERIEVTGGEGIGVVTRKGLGLPVGSHAINRVPMTMIAEAIREVLPSREGVKVVIHAPQGAERAKKTMNPRLGIVGGISILGTTGIVEPMSENAMKEALALTLSMLRAEGALSAVFVPGNYGMEFIRRNFSFPQRFIVKTGNYAGHMLLAAAELGIERILWVGHAGKIIKMAGGIFNTHSRVADGRMEILAAHCALQGCSTSLVRSIMESATTEEAIEHIKKENLQAVFTHLAAKVSGRCEEYTGKRVKVGTIIFTLGQGLLGICPEGEKMREEFAGA